jgi:hypothetical protein
MVILATYKLITAKQIRMSDPSVSKIRIIAAIPGENWVG